MGFGKAFLLSLVAFVGLNFIFTILYYLFSSDGLDALFTTIRDTPLMIFYYLFGSIVSNPYNNLEWLVVEPLLNDNMDNLILGLGFFIAPLVAAILAGHFGESKSQSFSGWLLTAIISSVVLIIVELSELSPSLQDAITTTYGWSSVETIIIYTTLSFLINLVFYSFFTLMIFKTEYY